MGNKNSQITAADIIRVFPLPICWTKTNFKIEGATWSFLSHFNLKKQEILGKDIGEFFAAPRSFEEIKKEIKNEKKIINEEVKFYFSDKPYFVDLFVSLVGEGEGEKGIIFSFRDISSQKIQEYQEKKKLSRLRDFAKELKDSRDALLNITEDIEEAKRSAEIEKDKTTAIVKNFPEGLIFLDKSGKISSLNPKAKDIFNVSEEGAKGKTLSDFFSSKSLESLLEALKESKESAGKEEVSLFGGNLILEVSRISVMGKNERIGTLVILGDITRSKVMEKLKTEFVSIAAHQLRTPLSAIKWTLKMLLDGDLGKITSEQRDFLLKTYKSNERMVHLISDLLNATRIEEGRFIYKPRRQNVIEIAEEAISPISDLAKRKGVEFKFQKPEEIIPHIKIDGEKISIVFQNLTENAIHYTSKGGAVKMSASLRKKKGDILFKVEDTGIGISKEQQKRVFSRFFRGANAVKSETEGTGLGLYITKNIVEAHKGKIWFESGEEKGSIFYFTLPLN